MAGPFPEHLTTRRLTLRRMRRADYPDYLAMNQDPRVMATLGGLQPEKELARRHQFNLDHWDKHGFGWWSAYVGSNGRYAGRGGLRRIVLEGRDEMELGYGFVPDFWGQGIATEFALATVQVGFDVLDLAEMVCFTLPTNKASRRVMEKVGFVYERDGTWADLPHVFFRLTKTMWEHQKCGTP
jgi:ribosomal-protein-alanine N-acetyltransferase